MSVYVRSPFGFDYCEAGRRARFGGRWTGIPPCIHPGRHVIGSEAATPAIKLCDQHFAEVDEAGLVTDPYIDEDEFERRYGGPKA